MRHPLKIACALVLGSSMLLGCGSKQEVKPVDVKLDEERRDYDPTRSMGATAEVGAMPEEESVYAFKESLQGIQDCFVAGSQRIEFLGGQISLQVWVNETGQAQTVFADRSTLGDRQTERCMFDTLKGAPWPKPVGGPIAMAQNSFEFEMTGDVRAPVTWDEEQVESALANSRGRIAECKGGARQKFLATVYVDTNGSALGVGMAAPDRTQEIHSECLVGVLAELQYPPPGSWPAKVSFQL
jgi:hypothetical protein